jgi:SAM-dependent methyltransferase
MKTESHYTFGDGDVAQDRLRLLAEAFAPSSRALLARLHGLPASDAGPVVDLGCGPGYTTDLLCELPGVGRVLAADRSPRLALAARARLEGRAEVVELDVAVAPLPLPPARLLYARFLLTHLRDVTRVLVGWRAAVLPRGLVVLEETAYMTSAHPAFRRYYALVERMQAHYGQAMYIGRSLDEAARLAGLSTVESRVEELELPAARMARLHALNLGTWKDDPFVQASFDPTELAELSATLGSIAAGDDEAPPVSCGVKQLALRRDDAGSSPANTSAKTTNAPQSAAR